MVEIILKGQLGFIASGIKMGGRIEPIMIKDSVFYLNKEDESDIIFEEQYNKSSAKKKQYDEVNRTDVTSLIIKDGKDIKSLFGGVRQSQVIIISLYIMDNFDNKQFENKFGKGFLSMEKLMVIS